MTEAELEVFPRDGVLVARIEGEVDLTNAAHVGERIQASSGNHLLGIVVDLTSTRYLDSAAIRMLFDLSTRTRTARQGLGIVVDGAAPVRRLIELVGLREVAIVGSDIGTCIEEIRRTASERL